MVLSVGGAQLLRLVPKERLHTAAAEANFRRASCGSSTVGLRHAALIAGLLNEQEAWLHSAHVAGTPLDARHSTREQPSSEPLGSRLFRTVSRGQRMEACVASAAIAAQKRELLVPAGDNRCGEEEQKGGPHGFLGHNELHKKSVLHKGHQIHIAFLQFAKRKYGNGLRAWVELDPEKTMRIGQMQFIRQVLEIGFNGNPHTMWKYLSNRHQTGTITLLDLDPVAAMLLAGFKNATSAVHGCTIKHKDVFDLLDENRSGKIYKDEFICAMRQFSFRGSSAHLFDLLDLRRMGSINVDDLAFIDRWSPPPYLFCVPDHGALQALKDILLHLHLTLLRGWRKVLDRDSKLRITWAEFSSVVSKIQARMQNKAARPLPMELLDRLPKTKEELRCCWRAIDVHCSGWVALSEFDEASYHILGEFKRWAVKSHGTVLKAFHQLDAGRPEGEDLAGRKDGKLSLGEFKRGLKGDPHWKGDIQALFEALDLNNVGTLTESEVKFLDNWDIDWDDWEVSIKEESRGDMASPREQKR